MSVIFIIFFEGSRQTIQLFRFAAVWKVPEGFQKLVRKLTRVFHFCRSSGRFRKVSGSLSRSLLLFCMHGCSSGSFRKVPGSLSGNLFGVIHLPHSGSFRKVSGSPTGRGMKHQIIDLGLVSWTSSDISISLASITTWHTLMNRLMPISFSSQMLCLQRPRKYTSGFWEPGSGICHSSKRMVDGCLSCLKISSKIPGSFPEAFWKVPGSWREICSLGAFDLFSFDAFLYSKLLPQNVTNLVRAPLWSCSTSLM